MPQMVATITEPQEYTQFVGQLRANLLENITLYSSGVYRQPEFMTNGRSMVAAYTAVLHALEDAHLTTAEIVSHKLTQLKHDIEVEYHTANRSRQNTLSDLYRIYSTYEDKFAQRIHEERRWQEQVEQQRRLAEMMERMTTLRTTVPQLEHDGDPKKRRLLVKETGTRYVLFFDCCDDTYKVWDELMLAVVFEAGEDAMDTPRKAEAFVERENEAYRERIGYVA